MILTYLRLKVNKEVAFLSGSKSLAAGHRRDPNFEIFFSEFGTSRTVERPSVCRRFGVGHWHNWICGSVDGV